MNAFRPTHRIAYRLPDWVEVRRETGGNGTCWVDRAKVAYDTPNYVEPLPEATVRDYRGVPTVPPAPKRGSRLCFRVIGCEGYPIELFLQRNGEFAVRYGLAIHRDLAHDAAGQHLGYSIMHALHSSSVFGLGDPP